MESEDEEHMMVSEVEIEIDVAEEPELLWGPLCYCSGPTADSSERNARSPTTRSDRDCTIPSAVALLKSEPHSQPASGLGMKAEPVEQSGTVDECLQLQSADGGEGKVDFKRQRSNEPDPGAHFPSLPGAAKVDSNEKDRVDPKKFKRRQHVCNVCNKQFSRSDSLKRHTRIHSGCKQFKCDECGKAFSQAEALKRHLLIHTGDKPFVCDVCNRAFGQSCQLKRHSLIHTGPKAFACDICGNTFTQKRALNRHMLIHNKAQPLDRETDGVYPKFQSSNNDKVESEFSYEHIIASVHKEKKPHVSAVWSSAPETESGDADHCDSVDIEQKDGERKSVDKDLDDSNDTDMTDSEVGKDQQVNVNVDQTGRAGVEKKKKRHACGVCGKAFRWPSDVKRHMLTHTGHRQFVCGACGRAFTQAAHLKQHKMTHSDYKLSVCHVCSQAFPQARDGAKQSLLSDGDRTLSVCDVCCKDFIQVVT